MHLLPPNAPLDAFFAPVRRRHPDVDLVVLPAPEPQASTTTVDEATAAATLDRVASAARRMQPALPATASPTTRWSYGPTEGTVVAATRFDASTPDGFAALVSLRGALEAEGWRVRRLPGAVERLSGERDDLRLEASYAEETGAFLLEVRSQPAYVGTARARRLVRQ